MTRLEEEIAEVIENAEYADDSTEVKANLIAEVAKRYITKAIIELSDMNTERIDTNEWRERWLKENGGIE